MFPMEWQNLTGSQFTRFSSKPIFISTTPHAPFFFGGNLVFCPFGPCPPGPIKRAALHFALQFRRTFRLLSCPAAPAQLNSQAGFVM